MTLTAPWSGIDFGYKKSNVKVIRLESFRVAVFAYRHSLDGATISCGPRALILIRISRYLLSHLPNIAMDGRVAMNRMFN